MLYATLASLCILAQVAPPFNSINERIDRFVREEMVAQHIPGAAVAVIKNGVTLRAEGYGVASIEHCMRAQRDSVFESGSLGKQFTAAGIMVLVERGKLNLDDPIARRLPSPARWGSITVRHLLTHTSGLPDDELVLNLRRDYTENELALLTASLPRRYRPGKHFQYSNLGYALLGLIIRRVSGQFYGDFLRENIFIPAGMHTTRIISEADIVPKRVAGYRLVAKQIKNQEWVAPSHNTTADGALHVTLLDLIAWERVVRTRALLSAESWSKIFQPATLLNGRKSSYGFAWELERQGGKDIHYHDGKRKTRRDRMRVKLKEVKGELRQRMHQPIPEQGRWLKQVVTGYFAYHAVPTNSRALRTFRNHVVDLWRRTLRRRSQKDRMTWGRISKLADDFLPKPRILHPWPSDRFGGRSLRWEPSAQIGLARICAGGAQ